MNRRWSVILAVAVAACGPAKSPAPAANQVDPRMAAVVNGLRPGITIKGEAPVRWTLAERMAHYKVPGLSVAIIDSGRIVWARGFGTKAFGGTDSVTTETLFQAGSISKPTFAVGLMRLVQDGKLSLDEDVNVKLTSWKVPENKFTSTEKVTLRRVLSHQAGLTVHGFPGYEVGTPIPTVVQVLDGAKPANTAPVRVDTFPGAISRYSGGGTTIAMLVMTDLTGKPFPTLMKELVLDPAGMTHSTYDQPPANGATAAATGTYIDGKSVVGQFHLYPEMSAAGLWTTASDLATLAIELQHTWAGQSTKVINKATLSDMFTVQKKPFGIGYVVNGTGRDLSFEHSGADEGFQAQFIAFAERGQGMVALANSDNGIRLINELTTAVAEEYGWPTRLPTERVALVRDSAALAAIAGKYELTPTPTKEPMVATITLEGTKLFFSEPIFFGRVELIADSDSSFFFRSGGMPVRVIKDPGGKINEIALGNGVKGKRAE